MPKLVDQTTYSPEARHPRIRAWSAAWQAFARAFNAAGALSGASLAGSDLDPSEYDVLVTLVQGPAEGLRPTELVDRVLLTKSGITRLLDRLAERGLVERHACPSDRRGQLVALTPRGRGLLRRASPRVLRSLRATFGPLSSGDLEVLTRLSERIEEAATAHSTV